MKRAYITRAYLVGVIDTRATPPAFIGASIFSEPCPTISGFTFVILEGDGYTYPEAKQKILDDMARIPHYHWCKKVYKER